jgi:hypothetical protein
MRAFLAKHQYLVVWILGLIIVGSLAVLVLKLNGSFLPTGVALPQPGGGPAVPTPTPAPSVALTLGTSGKTNTLTITWQNLPGGTTALDIFRGKGNNTSTYTLWQTLAVSSGNGSANFTLGAADQGYNYYVQAEGGGGSGGENSTSTQVLWSSDPTTPSTPTPTPAATPASTPTPAGATPTPSPTPGNNNQSPTPSPTGTPGNSNTTTTTYTYYNPQVQGIGYGTANGSFWVEHVSQSIEIGWQDLPANANTIIISRSQSDSGPWNQMLAEQNPAENGSSSITLVDGTLDEPYYYEMTALDGSTTLGTYGPIYLPPAGE